MVGVKQGYFEDVVKHIEKRSGNGYVQRIKKKAKEIDQEEGQVKNDNGLDPLIKLHMDNLGYVHFVKEVKPGKTVRKPKPLEPGVSEVRRDNGHYQAGIVGEDGLLEKKVTLIPSKDCHVDLGILLNHYKECMGDTINQSYFRAKQ